MHKSFSKIAACAFLGHALNPVGVASRGSAAAAAWRAAKACEWLRFLFSFSFFFSRVLILKSVSEILVVKVMR